MVRVAGAGDDRDRAGEAVVVLSALESDGIEAGEVRVAEADRAAGALPSAPLPLAGTGVT